MKRFLQPLILSLLAVGTQAADLSIARIDSIADVRTAAITAYRKKELQLAADLYKQSIAMGDSSIIPFYNLACCYGRMGKADSCKIALKEAVERGYPDYIELGNDPDLQILQKDANGFSELWQKAFANSYGKVLAKNYDDLLKQTIIRKDTARIPFLLSPEHRKQAQLTDAAKTLQSVDTLLRFSNINDPKALTEKGYLGKRELKYVDNHFVTTEEFVYDLTVPFFDAEFSRLIAHNSLHVRQHTVDHLYTYLDSIYLQRNELLVKKTTLPVLTDSVMVLSLQSDGTEISDFQGKIGRDHKLCQKVVKMLGAATPITEVEFHQLQPKTGDVCFVRINNLPVRKQFKGLKVAFYRGSAVAVVVVDDSYYFVKGKFKL